MAEQPVRYEVVDSVAWLTINRPEARNALNNAVRTGLFDAVRRFNDDDAAKVLVLTGVGDKAFCAGGDLKEMAQNALKVPPKDFAPQFGRNIDVAKPTIAAVNGVAFAGGLPARAAVRPGRGCRTRDLRRQRGQSRPRVAVGGTAIVAGAPTRCHADPADRRPDHRRARPPGRLSQ
ncbi:hypothetical protein MINTMi198_23900 [Mycobacterium intracellulare M.i.198]|nr:hypothetical protein MINTMi198_23900 [Mycobacterium intracellulare M.i.198]